jgi:hypothetical protein
VETSNERTNKNDKFNQN